MPLLQRRAVAALCAAAALSLPAGTASAQSSAIPEDGAGVSATPPVPLGGGGDSGSQATSAGSGDGGGLPNTGSDPRLLFLTGLAITLLGVGLRLRTVDADDY